MYRSVLVFVVFIRFGTHSSFFVFAFCFLIRWDIYCDTVRSGRCPVHGRASAPFRAKSRPQGSPSLTPISSRHVHFLPSFLPVMPMPKSSVLRLSLRVRPILSAYSFPVKEACLKVFCQVSHGPNPLFCTPRSCLVHGVSILRLRPYFLVIPC